MKRLISLVFLCVLVCSCGYREGIIQKDEKSYLRFMGNVANVQVLIDDMQPFNIQANETKLYQIPPGKHQVAIYRDSKLIVNRVVYVQSQATMEVEIP